LRKKHFGKQNTMIEVKSSEVLLHLYSIINDIYKITVRSSIAAIVSVYEKQSK
jgi:hypothetical protein